MGDSLTRRGQETDGGYRLHGIDQWLKERQAEQPILLRCAHCAWTAAGTVAQTEGLYPQHLAKEHPELAPRTRKQVMDAYNKRRKAA